MAGLLGIYAHDMSKEDLGFYSAVMMRFLGHRGSRSAKASCAGMEKIGDQMFMDDGWQREFFYKTRSPAVAATVTKRTEEMMHRWNPNVFIDGYVRAGRSGMYDSKDLRSFEGALIDRVAGMDYHGAMDVLNGRVNGAVVMQTGDKLVGARSATGYKQLFHVTAAGDGVEFEALISEDGFKSVLPDMEIKVEALKPGEMIVIDRVGGVKRAASNVDGKTGEAIRLGYDHHEAIYTLHNNSTWNGTLVNKIRKDMGASIYAMHEDDFKKADIVSYVPDEPITMAIGFSRRSGKKFEEVLSKNRYEGGYQQRDYNALAPGTGRQLKLSVTDADMVRGKDVVIIDDSIVRGKHTETVVNLLRGICRTVRLVSGEIPIVSQRQVGIYTEDINKGLVARRIFDENKVRSIEDFERMVSEKYGVPVYYNSLKNISEVVGVKPENLDVPNWIRNVVAA